MQLKGSHVLPAPPERVWDLLMDTAVLAKVTPGISRLEETGEDQYKAIADVKLGPVKGSFEGELFVVDKEPPQQFKLDIRQESKIGNVAAEVLIHLAPVNDNESEMTFDGKARLSGLLARTGQRVLTGVANTLTKQFFAALTEEIQQQPDQ